MVVADDVSRYDAVVAGVAALLGVALVVVLVLFVVQQRSRRRRGRDPDGDEARSERERLERLTRRMQDVEARLREIAARDQRSAPADAAGQTRGTSTAGAGPEARPRGSDPDEPEGPPSA